MSTTKGLFGGLLNAIGAAGQVAIDRGVKGKARDLSGCTPCAASAKAASIYNRNVEMMGGGAKAKPKSKAKKPAAQPRAKSASH